ncbi:flagellar FliJ protein [Natranaerovirga pectinivora]|uniref:Flagellar FliJ protein n=1 Tax=Natranaerovirga pectinivora TaxID=682400 RepID=A0A4R3MN49_9FIRM|nr:flagellar export protein FliJ [Natranaerovirga pectinivora]TCT16423.1 flagellar FliJ protein [Natranaerovirga pectinivora]
MSKFKYKFQNILEIKHKIEDQKKLSYFNAVQAHSSQLDELYRMYDKKDDYENNLKTNVKRVVTAKNLRDYYNGLERIVEFCKEEESKLAELEQKLEITRIDMNTAVIDRKTYEKLKEKDFERFLEDEKLKENKIVDELISYKYFKPQKTGG